MDRGRKRKRPVTSCGECYRRKQKCDRELPCAICVARGVPEKCTFGDFDHNTSKALIVHLEENRDHLNEEFIAEFSTSPVVSQVLDETAHNVRSKKVRLAKAQAMDTPEFPQDLQQQTGYSLEKDSSFSMLHKVLNGTEKPPVDLAPPPSTAFSRLKLSQIAEIELQLPPRLVQSKLIDLFFTRSWWWFLAVEPGDFKSKFDRYHGQSGDDNTQTDKTSRKSLDFIALLFQTLAVALQHLPFQATDLWKDLHLYDARSITVLSERLSRAGDQIMEILGRHNSSVLAIQHDMVKGKWLKNVSRGKDSWSSLGHAVRQAQELGLHTEKSPPRALGQAELNDWLWQDVLNKRVWACLLGWDAHVAFTLGRPRMINISDCDRMAISMHELPYDTSKNPPPDAIPDGSPCLLTPVATNYATGYLIHDILNSGASKPRLRDYSIVGQLHDRLCDLSNSISPCFRYQNPDTSLDHLHKQIPEMRYHLASFVNTYLVALHRAHTLNQVKSCDAAVQAALTTLQAQQSLFDVTDEQYWRIYTYSFFTIDAAIFLAALLLEQPKTLSSRWSESIMTELKKALDRTEKMKDASFMAKTGSQIIRKCYDRIIQQGLGPINFSSVHGDLINSTLTVNPQDLYENQASGMINGTPNNGQSAPSPSLRSWIEQMDQVMLPMLDADTGEPFDNALWSTLLDF